MGAWQRAVFPGCTFRVGGDEFVVAEDEIAGRLEKSWAKPFAEKIFPKIDESCFICRYSNFSRKSVRTVHTKTSAGLRYLIKQVLFTHQKHHMKGQNIEEKIS